MTLNEEVVCDRFVLKIVVVWFIKVIKRVYLGILVYNISLISMHKQFDQFLHKCRIPGHILTSHGIRIATIICYTAVSRKVVSQTAKLRLRNIVSQVIMAVNGRGFYGCLREPHGGKKQHKHMCLFFLVPCC